MSQTTEAMETMIMTTMLLTTSTMATKNQKQTKEKEREKKHINIKMKKEAHTKYLVSFQMYDGTLCMRVFVCFFLCWRGLGAVCSNDSETGLWVRIDEQNIESGY